MWCFVKFVADGTELLRPLAFFENFESLKLQCHKEYNVFWSSKDEETPESVLKKEGKILHVDNIKKGRKSKNALPGFYKAVLLQYAETEDELQTALDGKRVSVPVKSLPSIDRPAEKEIPVKEKQSQSRKRNVSLLTSGYPLTSLSNNKMQGTSSTSPEDELPLSEVKLMTEEKQELLSKYEKQKKKVKLMTQEIDTLKEKLKKEEECAREAEEEAKRQENRNKILEEELSFVRKLNYELQKKLLLSNSLLEKNNANNIEEIHDGKGLTKETGPFRACSTPLLSSGITNQSVTFDLDDQQMEDNEGSVIFDSNVLVLSVPADSDIQRGNQTGFGTLPGTSNQIGDKEKEPNKEDKTPRLVVPSVSSAVAKPFPSDSLITEIQFRAASKTKKGQYGDSQFVKNLADVLWTREELSKRTATGAAPRKKGVLDNTDEGHDPEPRLECSPPKKACILDMLKYRIQEEEQETQLKVPEDEVKRRLSQINKILKAKIGTVRSQLGLK